MAAAWLRAAEVVLLECPLLADSGHLALITTVLPLRCTIARVVEGWRLAKNGSEGEGMKHVLGVALLVAFSTVAVAGVDNIKPSRTLKPEEGILVTSVKCGYPVNFLQIYKSGTASTGFWGPAKFDTVVTCQKGVKTLRMKAGRYYIGWLATGGDGTSIPEVDAVKFTIEAGKLNYIGDIYAGNVPPFDMDADTLIHTTGRLVSIIDRESEAKSQLAADHGWLLDRHAFMRSMAEEPGASPPKEPQEADASAAGGRP